MTTCVSVLNKGFQDKPMVASKKVAELGNRSELQTDESAGLNHSLLCGAVWPVAIKRSQKQVASDTQPSALVPTPVPKPWPTFEYWRYSTAVPALFSVSARRFITLGGAIPSWSPTTIKVGGSFEE